VAARAVCYSVERSAGAADDDVEIGVGDGGGGGW